MKRKYVLLLDDEVNNKLMVNFVWFGSNHRDKSMLCQVNERTKANSCLYFQIYSVQVMEFLKNLAAQIYSNQNDAFSRFLMFNTRNLTPKQALKLL